METRAERICPYSSETLVACPNYQAVAEHADYPGAETCRYLVVRQVSRQVRRLVCERERREPGQPQL